MPESLLALVFLAPLFTAALLGASLLGLFECGERLARRSAEAGLALAALAALGVLILDPGEIILASWLKIGAWSIDLSLLSGRPRAALGLSVALLGLYTARFSATYLHREPAFTRFFAGLGLAVGGAELLLLSGDAVTGFAGWEAMGVASALLIAWRPAREGAARSAERVLLTNRVGDAAFLLGLGGLVALTGETRWDALGARLQGLSVWSCGAVASCFLLAALVKSAQIPFSPWISRAMEGPTPSGALFYGAVVSQGGLFLLLHAQPLIAANAAVGSVLLLAGLGSAVGLGLASLAQPDAKGGLVLGGAARVGLAFAALSLGWVWAAALIGLAAGVERTLRLLRAPGQLHDRPPAVAWRAAPRLHRLALDRLGLEGLHARWVGAPLLALAARLLRWDAALERALGQGEAKARAGEEGVGVVSQSTELLARLADWLEEALISGGIGRALPRMTGVVGWRLGAVEAVLARPEVAFLLAIGLALVAWGAAG